jgi:membrane-bound lytic murein transglycosylase B
VATGSYAGAMGAGQFIPSSYTAYAVDGNADGRRDLWNDWSDVLASIANYLAVHGWNAGEPVTVRATRPADWRGPEPDNRLGLDTTVGALRELGYEFETSQPGSAPATVMALENGEGSFEYWIGFNNFHVITRYNRSHKYAHAVHQLGQAIRSAYEASRSEQVIP